MDSIITANQGAQQAKLKHSLKLQAVRNCCSAVGKHDYRAKASRGLVASFQLRSTEDPFVGLLVADFSHQDALHMHGVACDSTLCTQDPAGPRSVAPHIELTKPVCRAIYAGIDVRNTGSGDGRWPTGVPSIGVAGISSSRDGGGAS